jgi:N-formylglutamate deformylase
VIHEAPFEVVEPKAAESPVVVEVPHASLRIDPEAMTHIIAPARSIARDADLHVDALFQDAPSEGATLIYARTSRYVVDLNRGETDCDSEAVEGAGKGSWPRGVVWRLTTDGDPILAGRLPREEYERRIALVYRPYHAALAGILARKKARFGFAILVCAHSMPTQGRRGHVDLGSWRADLVPGTRGRTTAAGALIDEVDQHGRSFGWTVVHDDPYKGGFSTAHYGNPEGKVHAVQLELARRLYMDEERLRIHPEGFQTVREFARTLVARLPIGKEDLAAGSPRRTSAVARRD